MNSHGSRTIALLIDGENAQPKLIEHILAETAKYGNVTTRRIYGDWTTPNMSGWKDSLHTFAIQPEQQFSYTTGKNSTDSALIIDAMDILHAGTVNGFCIVSSDSDYTRLVTRIREQAFFAMGVGRSDTPISFVNACNVFVYTENLLPQAKREKRAAVESASDWTQTLAQAIEMSTQDDEWAFLGTVGDQVRKLDPAFDPRSYGHRKLAQLVRSRPELFAMLESEKGGASHIFVQMKS